MSTASSSSAAPSAALAATIPIAVSRAEWDASREELRQKEKELSRLKDALTLQRRALPWLELPRDFALEDCSYAAPGRASAAAAAPKHTTLSALFGSHPQLVVYNCMSFTSGYPCGACSLIIEQLDAISAALEKQADTAVAVVCHGPADRLRACAALRQWRVRLYACSADFAEFVAAETLAAKVSGWGSRPTLSCFARGGTGLALPAGSDGKLFLTYATWMRGVEDVELVCGYVDRLPIAVKGGRQPGFLQWKELYGEASAEQVPPAAAKDAAAAGGSEKGCCHDK